MAFSRDKVAVGLDVGQTGPKTVKLALRNKELHVEGFDTFDARAEGILDEKELRTTIASRVEVRGWKKDPVVLGLPQYLATTQISDFPPGVAGTELEGMVNFETMQLAGISEETFSSGFHRMTAAYGRSNPVLIGVCRQSAVRERIDAWSGLALNPVDVAMNGLAAVNALFHLHPEIIAEATPQLVIDVGEDSSTMIVVAGGEVLFVGSLMAGGSHYTRAIADHLDISLVQADLAKRSATLGAPPAKPAGTPRVIVPRATPAGDAEPRPRTDLAEPLLSATRRFENELRTGIDHWRAGEREELGQQMFSRIWLCGGGAKLGGFADHLARTYGCEAIVFGPSREGQTSPELAAAFGLALQGLGLARIAISFCPEDVAWVLTRKHRFPYLVAAEAAFILGIALTLAFHYASLGNRMDALNEEMSLLRKCEQIVPQIERTTGTIRHYEKMLIPFAEKANRSGRVLAAMETLTTARGPDDWFVYFADELSFEEGKILATDKAAAAPTPAPSPAAGSSILFPGSLADIARAESRPIEGATQVLDMEQLRSLVVAGFTPHKRENQYEAVKAVTGNIEKSPLFERVDLMPQPKRKGREDDIFGPWEIFFRRPPLKRYTAFILILPFAELDVQKPVIPAKEGGRK